ncbi:MAG: glycosyltransferase, partial [Planctomycetes bacterium]|nr:glycosyltransferase [Planctomycetota bacterium]
VLVVPSFMEGLPVVIMEALAMGRAVIASRVAAIPELVVDGESGLLVTPSSVQDLVRALERCAQGRTELARFGRAGRARLEREFALEIVGAQMADLFRRYAGENASS